MNDCRRDTLICTNCVSVAHHATGSLFCIHFSPPADETDVSSDEEEAMPGTLDPGSGTAGRGIDTAGATRTAGVEDRTEKMFNDLVESGVLVSVRPHHSGEEEH